MSISGDRRAIREFITRRVAQELRDGDFVNLGIGLPTLVAQFLPPEVNVTLQAEVGMVGVGGIPDAEHAEPRYIVDAGGQPSSVRIGGAFIDSLMSFGLMRGGHVDVTVLGALEVDAEGNLANWMIPDKLAPGMGGAMDLVVGAKRIIIAMEHTREGTPKILPHCSLPLTAQGCVDLIITEMGVIKVTPGGLVLTEINPEYSVDQVRAATAAELDIADPLPAML